MIRRLNNVFLVSRQSFEFLHIGVLMMACSGKYINHLGNNAGQIPVVVGMALGSSKYLYHIYLVVALHPECRHSSSFCESFEGFSKPLLKHCHCVYVSGSNLLISHFSMKVLVTASSSSARTSFLVC